MTGSHGDQRPWCHDGMGLHAGSPKCRGPGVGGAFHLTQLSSMEEFTAFQRAVAGACSVGQLVNACSPGRFGFRQPHGMDGDGPMMLTKRTLLGYAQPPMMSAGGGSRVGLVYEGEPWQTEVRGLDLIPEISDCASCMITFSKPLTCTCLLYLQPESRC